MKRILKDAEGRKVSLNTETADLVYKIGVGAEGADPSWERAALYRTRNADFFLCGRGGSESRWRLPDGKAPRHENIAFVTADEARALLEAHGQFETVDAYFAAEVPGEVRLPVRLSGVMAAKLEAAAKADRRSVNAWVLAAIEERLAARQTRSASAPHERVAEEDQVEEEDEEAMRGLRTYFDAQEAAGALPG